MFEFVLTIITFAAVMSGPVFLTAIVESAASKVRIPAFGSPCEPQSEEYRARAAECHRLADRWSGLIKRQYEDLARVWLTVAELAERKVGAARG